jgi:hypothetical protein
MVEIAYSSFFTSVCRSQTNKQPAMATKLHNTCDDHFFTFNFKTMRIRDDEFPVVVQAYDPSGSRDAFIAEQVVFTQVEIDNFTSRYAGMLIKAREFNEAETTNDAQAVDSSLVRKRKTRSGSRVGWVLFILVLIIGLLVWGFATGWIQKNFGINPPI